MRVDHLILGAASLEAGVRFFEELSGVRAAEGGRHVRWGTRNALVSLGGDRYLEVLAPDPSVPSPEAPRPWGLEHLSEPRLLTWVASGDDLDDCVARAAAAGADLGEVISGSRQQPDGTALRWRMTDLLMPREGGVLPFLIDWGDTPHPSAALEPACTLIELAATHPEADRVGKILEAMGLSLPITSASEPGLVASIETPRGVIQLR